MTMKELDIFRDCIDKSINSSNYVVRGKYMRNWSDVLREFSAALQFPYYFGFNYAALNDCMSDLSWIYDDIIFIIISDYDLMLQNKNERDDFLNDLEENAIVAGNDSMDFFNLKKDVYILCQSEENKTHIKTVEKLIKEVKEHCGVCFKHNINIT